MHGKVHSFIIWSKIYYQSQGCWIRKVKPKIIVISNVKTLATVPSWWVERPHALYLLSMASTFFLVWGRHIMHGKGQITFQRKSNWWIIDNSLRYIYVYLRVSSIHQKCTAYDRTKPSLKVAKPPIAKPSRFFSAKLQSQSPLLSSCPNNHRLLPCLHSG